MALDVDMDMDMGYGGADEAIWRRHERSSRANMHLSNACNMANQGGMQHTHEHDMT